MFAAGLACNAAAAGWRVLLIDCDFRRPSIALHFGQAPAPGLSEVLKGGMLGDSQTIIREARPRLHVMPAGTAGGDPQELLASNRMSQLLSAVRARYDLVILDTPPVLPVADALVLARHADATLMVVRWEKTPRSVVQDATRLLRNSGAHFLGAVLTHVELRTAAQMGGRPAKAYDYYSGYNGFRT
jgi:capsular exopolysaccharide synthesis family protein